MSDFIKTNQVCEKFQEKCTPVSQETLNLWAQQETEADEKLIRCARSSLVLGALSIIAWAGIIEGCQYAVKMCSHQEPIVQKDVPFQKVR